MHYLLMRDGERDERATVGKRVFGGKGEEEERKKRKFFSRVPFQHSCCLSSRRNKQKKKRDASVLLVVVRSAVWQKKWDHRFLNTCHNSAQPPFALGLTLFPLTCLQPQRPHSLPHLLVHPHISHRTNVIQHHVCKIHIVQLIATQDSFPLAPADKPIHNSHHRIVSAPGKVLLAGGYLVLDPAFSGLVVATDARFYTLVRPANHSNETTPSSKITVRSPQFENATWNYLVDIKDKNVQLSPRYSQGARHQLLRKKGTCSNAH